MPHDSIGQFIAHARDKGLDHATIRMLLLSNGWKEKDIARALTQEALTMPVPLPPDTGGAREAFFHLLSFGGLYTTLISVIVLAFTYINRLFPDVALESSPLREGELSTIRWSMAVLIIGFPLLIFMSRAVLKDIAHHQDHAASGNRRWLTYLTLLVTAAAIAGTLVTLVFYLLEGELSIRFLLKVFVALSLSGLTFLYEFQALRFIPGTDVARRLHRTFFWIATSVVVVVLVWGALLIGSPMQERLRKIDERRVEDLQAISSEIYSYIYQDEFPKVIEQEGPLRALPESLATIPQNARYYRLELADPETGEPYEYTVESGRKAFSLCAVFTDARTHDYDVFWDHPAGRHCFAFDVNDRRF